MPEGPIAQQGSLHEASVYLFYNPMFRFSGPVGHKAGSGPGFFWVWASLNPKGGGVGSLWVDTK